MNSIEGTLIVMNDGEEIFINHTKEQINSAIDEATAVGRKYITIIHLDRDIYFNYIKDKKRKTRILALEAPKQVYKEKTVAEREKIAETIRKAYRITEEGRKKRFIERKQEILLELEKKELEFGLDSTLEKLKYYNKLKLENDKKTVV